MIKGKKGSIQDIAFIGVILLFAAMVILIGFKVSSEFNTQIQSMSDIPTEAKTSSTELNAHYSGIVDNMFLILAIGIALVTLVLAALVRIHPIFIPFYFIGLLIVIFLSALFSNIYQEMAATPELATQAAQLTFISGILNVLPLIVGIFGFILMIVMYKLWSVGETA